MTMLYSVFADASDLELVTPEVLHVSLQFASVKNTKLQLEQHKTSQSTTQDTFVWKSHFRHNLIERYFPSMMQMNNCRVVCGFSCPLGLLSEPFLGVPVLKSTLSSLSCASSGFNSMYDLDSSYLLSNEWLDDSMSLHSFSLRENRVLSPTRTLILPFSDVTPKHIS